MYNHSTADTHRVILRCNELVYQYRFDQSYGINLSFAATIVLVVAIVTIISNLVIATVLISNKKCFDTPAFFLIKTTCVIDTMVGVRLIPSYSLAIFLSYHSTTYCVLYRIMVFLGHFLNILSSAMVTLISIDRYIAITKPYFYVKHITINNNVYKLCIAVASTLSVFVIVLSFVVENHLLLNATEVVYILIVLIINITLHVKIHQIVKSIDKSYKQRIGTQYSNNLTSNCERKGAFSSILFVVSLYICYVPYMVLSILFVTDFIIEDMIYAVGIWTYIFIELKSLINPFLYVISLKSVRTKLFSIVKRLIKSQMKRRCKWKDEWNFQTGNR